MYKSKVKIESKGKLWDVTFELNTTKKRKLKFTYSSNQKEWESEAFNHGKIIDYKLTIKAPWGTGWEGQIEEDSSGKELIKWKFNNVGRSRKSIRTKPSKIQ